jgi:hypothetical protein
MLRLRVTVRFANSNAALSMTWLHHIAMPSAQRDSEILTVTVISRRD